MLKLKSIKYYCKAVYLNGERVSNVKKVDLEKGIYTTLEYTSEEDSPQEIKYEVTDNHSLLLSTNNG